MRHYDKIVLASNSPRRKELLAGLDLPFEVHVKPHIEERYPSTLAVEEIPQYLSQQKSAAYEVADGELLITADTIVVLNGRVYGKPVDEQDAVRMLHDLSGRQHLVITGVTLRDSTHARSFHVITKVTFKKLTDEEIEYYVSHYHPLDKAGAYGVQEWIGYIGVSHLEGSFYNVMGLPVQRIYEELQTF